MKMKLDIVGRIEMNNCWSQDTKMTPVVGSQEDRRWRRRRSRRGRRSRRSAGGSSGPSTGSRRSWTGRRSRRAAGRQGSCRSGRSRCTRTKCSGSDSLENNLAL